MIKLFDIQNNKVTPTEHCYTISTLKDIMDKYPKDYNSIYAYLFYMSCLNDEENPFAGVPELDKEELILKEVGGSFSADDKEIFKALELTRRLYETPRYRMYRAAKTMMDKIAKYLETTPVTDGRDGNIGAVHKTLKEFDEICVSVEARERAFKEENSTIARGNAQIAYDQM